MSLPVSYTLEHFGEILTKDLLDYQVIQLSDQEYKVTIDGKSHTLRICSLDPEQKTFEIAVDGIKIKGEGMTELDLLIDQLGFHSNAAHSVKEILAPMPGLVLDIKVSVGDSVNETDPLLVLEAMKMENIIKSPGSGTVKSISVKATDAVDKGQILLEFE